MRETSVVLLFLVGLATAFVGDALVRLDPALHHAGLAHVLHTMLLAVPAGVGGALVLREERIALAAALAACGWLAGLAVMTLAG